MGFVFTSKRNTRGELIDLPSFEQDSIEILCLKFWGPRTGSYTCTTIYRPPKGLIEKALQSLDNVITSLADRDKKNLIIHGDFNVDYNNKHCKWANKLKSWETKNGYPQVIRSDTRTCVDSSTMIDLCFTNVKFLKLIGTLNVNVSDHLPTYIVIKKGREEKTPNKFKGRDYSQLTRPKVSDEINMVRHHICGEIAPTVSGVL